MPLSKVKVRDKGLVVSGALLALIDLPPGIEARPLGAVRPKGKKQALELFEIVRSVTAVT